MSTGAQYATGDQWKNNSRKNEETELKQKQDREWTVVQIMKFLITNSDLNRRKMGKPLDHLDMT